MEISCLNCNHFPVCRISIKAREVQIWRGDIVQFYRTEAQSCDYYETGEKGGKKCGGADTIKNGLPKGKPETSV